MAASRWHERADRRGLIRWIVPRLGRRTRALLLGSFALAFVVRAFGLLAAFLLAAGRNEPAVVLGLAATAASLVQRTVATRARVDAECDLHVATTEALLASDVLEDPVVEPHLALHEGIHTATDLVALAMPVLAADVLAVFPASFALWTTLTPRAFGLVFLAASLVAGLTLLLRRRVRSLHERAVLAQQALGDTFTTAFHGRLELVASGLEAVTVERVRAATRHYGREARSSALGVTLLGRAPLALGVALAGAALVSTGEVSFASSTLQLRPLIVLAAAVPITLGVIFGLQQLVRATSHLEPFARIVLEPARADVGRAAGAVTEGPEALALEGVTFAYAPGATVLEDRSLVWNRGVSIVRGPNGTGKSTILRLALGLRDPSAGLVRFRSVALPELDLRALRARFAFLPQRPYLGEPYASVKDAFELLSPGVTLDAMREALDHVGLGVPLERTIGALSVGQRQRLALARVLARNAEVVLLDEPDANLDADGVARLITIIETLGDTAIVAVAAHGPLAAALEVAIELRGKEP